jgi:YidC/Oxa1 family membrane protein insertase
LEPGDAIVHKFKLFAGPKKPSLLAKDEYHLGELVYFGWPIFAAVAVPLTSMLHFFYSMVGNYGLAIIMLTVLVRGCMFPLSRKQALGAQKMQELQPEIKKIQEKHKNNAEGRGKAQQELFRKHNYNPLSGCLVAFIQLPIFIGLYRSLMVAIELRDAPLISNSIRWCSNLAAPDMLFDWSAFMPVFVNSGIGMFGLGPYFNLLPILTIGLFIMQQKMFMPPAADEQAAMQQKIMQYMMIFMGLMFFKVASGLCIYFIASSLWGLAERQFLPKSKVVMSTEVETRAQAKARARQESSGKK